MKKRADDPVFAHTTSLQTFYACRGCGRDQTDAWLAIQPAPPVVPVIGEPDPFVPPADKETIQEAAMRLGIAAQVKVPT